MNKPFSHAIVGSKRMRNVQLGLGLIGIGKPWGYRPVPAPDEASTQTFLEAAWQAGIRYFDTAASYGLSEQRLGRFLKKLSPAERSEATVATKFGEHWDELAGQLYVDHSYPALRASLDPSVDRLGAIDILQLHKTTAVVLRSTDLACAWDYAASLGIRIVGPSVSDLESAQIACRSGYGILQLPYNMENDRFQPVIDRAVENRMLVAVNRPFAMGKIVHDGAPEERLGRMSAAFRFILEQPFDGVVLTGTTSAEHLRENCQAFQSARGAESTPGVRA